MEIEKLYPFEYISLIYIIINGYIGIIGVIFFRYLYNMRISNTRKKNTSIFLNYQRNIPIILKNYSAK